MNISFNGYDTKYVTMKTSNASVGDFVLLNDNNELEKSNENSNFIGVVVAKRDNIATVQEQGYVECNYDGDIILNGYHSLVMSSNNKVKADESKGKRAYKILKIDKVNKIVGFLL